MKSTSFFAATLASLFSLGAALPFRSSVLTTRNFGELESYDHIARGLADVEMFDARDLGETDYFDFSAREVTELDARAKTVTTPTTPTPPKPAAGKGGKTVSKTSKPVVKGSGPSCRKRDGDCSKLFVVWYKPKAVGVARHWSLFLTPSAAIQGASGTIYEAIHHSQIPGGLGPNRRPGTVATKAGDFEGSKLLYEISAATFETFYTEYKMQLLEMIADHNTEPQNLKPECQSNCQHWVKDMAGVAAPSDATGAPIVPNFSGVLA
jgi:hypothetical protein